MNRTARALPVAVLALLPAAARGQTGPPQENYSIRVEYREFRPDFTGEIQKGLGDSEGTVIDIVDDLGIVDDRTFEIRGGLQIKHGHKLRGSYTPLDYAGSVEDAGRRLIYGQLVINRGEPIETRIKGAYWSGAYEFDFVKGPRGFLGGTVGAKFVDVDTTIVATNQNQREQDSWRSPVPSLGAITRMYAGRVSLEGEVSGFTLGDRGSLIEFDVAARLHISDRLAASGGYRYLKIRGEDDRDSADIHLEGWHFGLELSL
ncbi:MAG TPA: hypothetical protein VFQ51_17825 [Vicinamibacteria bacterium]|nr:hypothetical protein [Vicinamibacteria bacterium]